MSIKQHLKKHQIAYISCVAVAGITYLIMRDLSSRSIDYGTSVIAEHGISVNGKKVVMNNVSYISQNRQGPPSWVVRCKETGDIFTSQNKAAEHLNIPSSELSKHLNGLMDHVRGYHFERLCMSA